MEHTASTIFLNISIVGGCSDLPVLFVFACLNNFGLKLYQCSMQAFSGDQEHVDAHQASVHVWDIRRTSGNIPTLTLGRGSVSAASCVAEFQCAGPRANCLRWHPTNDRLLGTSSTIVGDSFAQGCIVQVWDITNGDQSRSMSNSESLTQQCGVAVIPTHCSLASSNTGTGNNFGLWPFDNNECFCVSAIALEEELFTLVRHPHGWLFG